MLHNAAVRSTIRARKTNFTLEFEHIKEHATTNQLNGICDKILSEINHHLRPSLVMLMNV